MEDILFYVTLSVVFVSLVFAIGGFFAYALDCRDARNKPMLTWASHHAPVWDKKGDVIARHEFCSTCETTVVSAGGQLASYSSME